MGAREDTRFNNAMLTLNMRRALCWKIIIGDKKAAEKTSQALREKSNEERDTARPDPNAAGVLLPNPASYLANPNLATASVMGNILASSLDPPKPPTADGEKSKENDNEASVKDGEKKEDKSEKKEDEPKAGEEKDSTMKTEPVEAPEETETDNQETVSV